MKYAMPRGTRDLLPDQAERFRHMENLAAELSRNYGYRELRTPIFEYSEIFERGVGEVTDIVQKEMYTFESKGGRRLTLRPEGTAPLVRSYIGNTLHGSSQPGKYFYFGPMFRYEAPQAGRYRQFWQYGIELLGAPGANADIEVIALGWHYLSDLGLAAETTISLNSIGCTDCRQRYRQLLTDFLQDKDLCNNCQNRLERNPLRVLDCKETGCQTQLTGAPLSNQLLCESCLDHFSKVQNGLTDLEIPFTIDGRLVRGLDYYNHTVFEYKTTRLGAQDAVGGGGRYDGLVELLGGPSVPAVGFAMGVDRIELMLSEKPRDLVRRGVWLITLEPATPRALAWVYKLRRQGIAVQFDLLERGFKSQFKQADKNNCRYALIIGPDELELGEVIIRDLALGTQEALALDKLTETLSSLEGVK